MGSNPTGGTYMLNTQMINGKFHTQCQMCEEYKLSHTQAGHSITGGMRLAFVGGYADYYDPIEKDEHVNMDICHECTVKVLKFIGIYNHPKFRGGHPSDKDAEPCCDNCWIPVYDQNNKWTAIKYPDGTIKANN